MTPRCAVSFFSTLADSKERYDAAVERYIDRHIQLLGMSRRG